MAKTKAKKNEITATRKYIKASVESSWPEENQITVHVDSGYRASYAELTLDEAKKFHAALDKAIKRLDAIQKIK